MRYRQVVLIGVCCIALGGCAKDSVLFVTNSSLGIDVETKPAVTASLAYEREEGFFGPRYNDGSIPPVVASLQTGGNIFNPAIRQFYATGDAALAATGAAPANPAQASGGRSGDPTTDGNDSKMALFGTATTLGFKLGFDGTSAYPDSFVFGYKRKEFSLIPTGKLGDHHTYASTLASIDSNTSTSGPANVTVGGPGNVGLTSSQFFATGSAATALATNPVVAKALGIAAVNAAAATLTPDQKNQVLALAAALSSTQQANLTKISGKLGDATFATDRDALVAGASPALLAPTANMLKSKQTKADFLAALNSDPNSAAAISAGIQ